MRFLLQRGFHILSPLHEGRKLNCSDNKKTAFTARVKNGKKYFTCNPRITFIVRFYNNEQRSTFVNYELTKILKSHSLVIPEIKNIHNNLSTVHYFIKTSLLIWIRGWVVKELSVRKRLFLLSSLAIRRTILLMNQFRMNKNEFSVGSHLHLEVSPGVGKASSWSNELLHKSFFATDSTKRVEKHVFIDIFTLLPIRIADKKERENSMDRSFWFTYIDIDPPPHPTPKVT